MTPENIRTLIPPYLSGDLNQEESEVLESHLEADPTLAVEINNLRELWAQLGLLPKAQPSAALRAQFYQKLNRTVQGRATKRGWFQVSWIWQLAAAAFVFIVGFGAGQMRRQANPEISQLQSQVEGLRQTVALSMMAKPSASSRLEGVEWSSQVARPDQELTTALFTTLNDDQNINVRLAALDALEKFTGMPAVVRGLEQSIGRQQSPLVQIALIDALVHVRDHSAADELKQLSGNAQVNAMVRQRAQWAIEKLSVN